MGTKTRARIRVWLSNCCTWERPPCSKRKPRKRSTAPQSLPLKAAGGSTSGRAAATACSNDSRTAPKGLATKSYGSPTIFRSLAPLSLPLPPSLRGCAWSLRRGHPSEWVDIRGFPPSLPAKIEGTCLAGGWRAVVETDGSHDQGWFRCTSP